MKYKTELQKFITGQYVYAGVRITLACVVPAVILAYFGLLKEYFLFPLATSLMGLTDVPGPFTRRRNALILAVFCFFIVALVSGLVKEYPALVVIEILVFGILLTMIGVYGQRLAAVGALAMVVLSIFIDPHLSGDSLPKALLILLAGSSWFVVVYLLVYKIQPYKLASQMIGENYLELASFLSIKAKFYMENAEVSKLNKQIISKQVVIKNLQEETRETVFRTRTLVNESTTTSRLLMMMFLNSFDLHEKLMTSENDYKKIQESFGSTGFLPKIGKYLLSLSDEMTNIGIALQGNTKAKPIHNIDQLHKELYEQYFQMRERELKANNLEYFMVLRQILIRVNELTEDIKNIYAIYSQDIRLAKSLSSGIDYNLFMPKEEKLNYRVFINNFSLNSQHFRHAIRFTLALLIGYGFSFIDSFVGHPYWILITIIAILRPSYSITKSRNLLRLYGTIWGGVLAYVLLYFVENSTILLAVLFISMILCFTFMRGKYLLAVLFMTVYIFLGFNFINPGNINVIFKDRLIDTAIAGGIIFVVSYLVLPVWERTQNLVLMRESTKSDKKYFDVVMKALQTSDFHEVEYRLSRKDAVIALANLSDNFQRMISDPKNQQNKLEILHQFVTTSHLTTAYIASLSQFAKTKKNRVELDLEQWRKKINLEFEKILSYFNQTDYPMEKIERPKNELSILLSERKNKMETEDFIPSNNPKDISSLAESQNIQNILELIYSTVREQRKIVEKHYKESLNPQV